MNSSDKRFFSVEIMEARRKQHNVFQVLKELSTSKTILQDEGEIKTFLDERGKKKNSSLEINSESMTKVNPSSIKKMKQRRRRRGRGRRKGRGRRQRRCRGRRRRGRRRGNNFGASERIKEQWKE